jgi:hypothetical protein
MFPVTPIYESQVEGENVIVFGLMQDVIVPDASDIVFTVPVAGSKRLDLIANEFYGVPDLWWVIARVNGILDPLVGIETGTRIRVPSKSRLAREGLLSV